MKYAIIIVTDGNYAVHAEGFTSVESAKISYHNLCAALWNDPNTDKACVRIIDENLDTVEGYREHVTHPAPVEPTA